MTLDVEVAEIVDRARLSIARGRRNLENVDAVRPARTYVDKANEIARWVRPCRILDWGCNYGQMAWLLRRRGFDVMAFDVEQNRHETPLLDAIGVQPIFGRDATRLPFDTAGFDAVLSCGVLEHVDDPRGSIGEIARILRPGGMFFIFNLPNRWSWIEWLARQRGGGHERRYTFRSASALLGEAGLETLHTGYDGVLPCTFSLLPEAVRGAVQEGAAVLAPLERLCVRTPLCILSTNLTMFARRHGERPRP